MKRTTEVIYETEELIVKFRCGFTGFCDQCNTLWGALAGEWTIELPLSDNPFLRSVSATDVEQYDLAEIQDVILALEYETTPASS